MVSIPVLQAATTGFRGTAGHVNQFFGAHQSRFMYKGSVTTQQATGAASYVSTQNTYLAQLFTVPGGQTTIGSVNVQINAVGGSPTLTLIPPLTVGLFATVGSVPTGSALVSVTLPSTYVYSSPFWVSIPVQLFGVTTGSVYAIVVTAAGTATHYYAMQQSNQTSGAATSPDGVTWTAQTYGFMYQVLDQSSAGNGQVLTIYEDNGARVTQFTYNTNGTVASIVETTLSQSSSAPLTSTRTLSYTNGVLTGVS